MRLLSAGVYTAVGGQLKVCGTGLTGILQQGGISIVSWEVLELWLPRVRESCSQGIAEISASGCMPVAAAQPNMSPEDGQDLENVESWGSGKGERARHALQWGTGYPPHPITNTFPQWLGTSNVNNLFIITQTSEYTQKHRPA